MNSTDYSYFLNHIYYAWLTDKHYHITTTAVAATATATITQTLLD